MPFNGSGVFQSLPAPTFPAIAGQIIYADRFNNNLSDIFSGLTNCITRDGQSPASANLPMNGFKLTGLGDGTAIGQALVYNQAAPALLQKLSLTDQFTVTRSGQVNTNTFINWTDGSTSTGYLSVRTGGVGVGSDGHLDLSSGQGGTPNAFNLRVRVSDVGHIGIGGAPSAWSSASTNRAIQMFTASVLHTGGQGIFGNNYYFDGTNDRRITAAPASRLVQGNTGFVTLQQVGSGAADSTIAWNQTLQVDLNSHMSFGTGITLSAWGSAHHAIQMRGGALLSGSTSELYLNQNAYYDGSADRYIAAGLATSFGQTGGTYLFRYAASGAANGAIAWNTALAIDTSGTVTYGGLEVGYRNIPIITGAPERGKCRLDGGSGATFGADSPGACYTVYNDTASSITLTASGITMRLGGTTTSGNRTVAPRGLATVLYLRNTEVIVSGPGVS